VSTSSTEMVRLFIAVRPGKVVVEELTRVQQLLKKSFSNSGLRIKWSEPETFHITLLFLGNVPAENLAEINRALEEGLRGVSGFKTHLNGAGLFRKSGAFWVGIESSPELMELQKCVANTLKKDEKRFHAHFTLGRMKTGQSDAECMERLESVDVTSVEFDIRSVELVKSELLPDGAYHTVVGRTNLQ